MQEVIFSRETKKLLHPSLSFNTITLKNSMSQKHLCYIINFIVHLSSHFLQSTLHWSCFIFISFSSQFISFISSTIVLLVHIYLVWLGIPEFLGSACKCWTLDSGCWTLVAGLWTLYTGLWTLYLVHWTLDAERWDATLWTLDALVDCFRTKSEATFWFCLIKLLKILWVRISKDLMVTLVL